MKSISSTSSLTLAFLNLCVPVYPAILDFARELLNTNLDYQAPMMNIPNIFLPGSSGSDGKDSSDKGGVIISDVIGKERSIGIFAGFTRDVNTVAKRLDDGSQNTTVLAPTNGALQKLPRKPWEDPEDYEALGQDAYTGSSGESRAQRNLRRFVEAHVVPKSPWKSGEKMQSMGGGEVWWEEVDGKKMVSSQPLVPLVMVRCSQSVDQTR